MVEGFLTGYVGITVVLFLTGCGLPVPEELPIIAAGCLARTNEDILWPVMLGCTIFGALAGDCAIYLIGYFFGKAVLKEHPWWVGFLTPEREKKAEYMIHHHGLKLLFVVRFLPGLRLPIYLTTGILKMPFRKFVLIDGLCAAVVVSVFFGLGYYFGPQILGVIKQVENALLYIVLGLVAVIGLLYYRKYRKGMAALAKSQAANGVSQEIATEGATAAEGDQVGEPNASA